ncbi:MAG: MarR family transcriptional regulator [Actinobacteria bacterium]|nr:MarR family transcriptional regulator [Actinomycetota bacterium]
MTPTSPTPATPRSAGTDDRPLSDGDYATLARFRHALRVFLHFSEDAARSAGMTPAQHQLLLAVKGWDGEQPPAIADLAELLQLRPHSTAELVHRAEAAGLVHTTSDPADHRRQLSALTPLGEARLRSLSLQHRDELRRFRSRMNDVLSELD